MNSQESAVTPPNDFIPPTPVTSTPKLCNLTSAPGLLPSSGSKRIPLKFVQSGNRKSTSLLQVGGPARQPKVSQSVSSIILGKNSIVVQETTPVRKPSQNPVRNTQTALQSSNETISKPPSDLVRSNSKLNSNLIRSSTMPQPSPAPSIGTMPKNKTLSLSTGGNGDNGRSTSANSKRRNNVRQATKSVLAKVKMVTQKETPQLLLSPPPLPPSPFPPPPPQGNIAMVSTHKLKTMPASAIKLKKQTGMIFTSPVNLPLSPKRAEICSQSSQPPPPCSGAIQIIPVHSNNQHDKVVPQINKKISTVSPKSRPSEANKKQLNSSFYSTVSNVSVKSRTALDEISNTRLNRGGQERVFNLSGASKVKKHKRKPKLGSSCSSSNASVASEYDLYAVPDSMPMDTTRTSVRSPQSANTSGSKRKYTRSCMYRYSYQEDEKEQVHEASPPRQKRCKTSSYSGVAKKTVSNTILASERTKRGPNRKSNFMVTSFDITISKFASVDSVQSTKPKSRRGCDKARARNNDHFVIERNIGQRKQVKEALEKARDNDLEDVTVSSQGSSHASMVHKIERSKIDVYEPEITPEPFSSLPRPTHKRIHAKISRQSKMYGKDAFDELPSAKRHRESTTAPLQSASSKRKHQNTCYDQSKKSLVGSSGSHAANFDEQASDNQGEYLSESYSHHKELLDTTSYGTSKNPLTTRQQKQPKRESQYYKSNYEDSGNISEDDTGNKISTIQGYEKISNTLHIQKCENDEVDKEKVETPPLLSPHGQVSFSLLSSSSPTPVTIMTKESENIVQGFENICNQLVAQSGKKDAGHAQKDEHLMSQTSVGVKPKGVNVETSMIPIADAEDRGAVTLTQLSRVR